MIIINDKMRNNPLVSQLNLVNLRGKLANHYIADFLKILTYKEKSLFLDYNHCQSPPDKNSIMSSFIDLTGYECALNSVYLSDFTENDVPIDLVLLNQYCSEIKRNKDKADVSAKIVFIAKIIDNGLIDIRVTFHLLRDNEYYLEKDIDIYNEAIIVIIA